MDTIDRSGSNLPARFPTASQSLPALGPVFTGDLATPSSPQINSRTILRGLTRHWGKILLLWLLVSGPIVFAIYRFVEPTYEAVSTLRIASTQTKLFEASRDDGESRSISHFIQTQAVLLTSDIVLDAAVANPNVVNLPEITNSTDPTGDLKKKLTAESIDGADLIRVGLELADGAQAATIVNAVVGAYLQYNTEFNRAANLTQTKNMEEHLKTIQAEVANKRGKLKAFYARTREAVPKARVNVDALKGDGDTTQPIFTETTGNHVEQMAQQMVKTDIDLTEVEAALKVLKDKDDVDQANEQANEQASEQDKEELQMLILDEFRKDPEVGALTEALKEVRDEREHTKSAARSPSDPARSCDRERIQEAKGAI